MDLTIWPQVNMINQKNYYTYAISISESFGFFHLHAELLQPVEF